MGKRKKKAKAFQIYCTSVAKVIAALAALIIAIAKLIDKL